MPVVEYMLHKVGKRALQAPHWVEDGGYWQSPFDNTMIGWVDSDRDYWVPDTVVTLTREEFITRAMAIHAQYPMVHPETERPDEPDYEAPTMSDDSATAWAGHWYDTFVAGKSG